MKRRACAAVIVLLLLPVLLLSRDARMPGRFTGVWYKVGGDRAYRFHEGIIEQIFPKETAAADGAYSFARDSITLFVTDMEALEGVQTLYWSENRDTEFLSRDSGGRKEILFFREKQDHVRIQ